MKFDINKNYKGKDLIETKSPDDSYLIKLGDIKLDKSGSRNICLWEQNNNNFDYKGINIVTHWWCHSEYFSLRRLIVIQMIEEELK